MTPPREAGEDPGAAKNLLVDALTETLRRVVREELRRCGIRPEKPVVPGAAFRIWQWDAAADAWVEIA